MESPKQAFEERIVTLANDTGFVRGSEPVELKAKLPPNSFVLVSNYAVMIVGFAEMTIASLREINEKIEAVISEVLLLMETKGMLVDGYSIVALSEEPKDELTDAIREIELNTSVCRKHVVWPKGNVKEQWDERLRYVTILGLPTNLVELTPPDENTLLPDKAQEILNKYNEGGSYKSAIQFIENISDAD